MWFQNYFGAMNPLGKNKSKSTSWWFQAIWKLLVKLDHFPQVGTKNDFFLKTPPRKQLGSNIYQGVSQGSFNMTPTQTMRCYLSGKSLKSTFA